MSLSVGVYVYLLVCTHIVWQNNCQLAEGRWKTEKLSDVWDVILNLKMSILTAYPLSYLTDSLKKSVKWF